jgi:hypothetical protein
MLGYISRSSESRDCAKYVVFATSGDGNAGANPDPDPTEKATLFGESIAIVGTD